MRAFPLLPLLLLPLASACAFEGGGLAPFTPAAAPPAEADLEVPYVPTPRPVVEAMLDMARVGPEDHLIDLGSGDGRIAIMAAQRGARALGVDLDPARIAEAAAAARLAQVEGRATFRRQDLFATPLREASVVTMYLLPQVNLRLRPRLLTELRPGTRIVSHAFAMGDWRPDAHREVNAANIYLWIVPAAAAGHWRIAGGPADGLLLELEQRFQAVSGTLGGRPLRDAALSGRRLTFTADLPGGPVAFEASVEDSQIVGGAPGSAASWLGRRED